jgi:excisionase family DNA binding protein
MAPERLYAPEEVAEYLQITKQTVMTHIRSRKLRARKVGRFWRVAESDLQAYIDTYVNQTTMITLGEGLPAIPLTVEKVSPVAIKQLEED